MKEYHEMTPAEILAFREICRHDEDLTWGFIKPGFFGSDFKDQDINCAICHKTLYEIRHSTQQVWKTMGPGKNPELVDPRTHGDPRLLKFLGRSGNPFDMARELQKKYLDAMGREKMGK
jgi:hypothetical protein